MEMKVQDGKRGGHILSYLGYNYRPDNKNRWLSAKQFWQCIQSKYGCSGRITIDPKTKRAINYKDHSHEPSDDQEEFHTCISPSTEAEDNNEILMEKNYPLQTEQIRKIENEQTTNKTSCIGPIISDEQTKQHLGNIDSVNTINPKETSDVLNYPNDECTSTKNNPPSAVAYSCNNENNSIRNSKENIDNESGIVILSKCKGKVRKIQHEGYIYSSDHPDSQNRLRWRCLVKVGVAQLKYCSGKMLTSRKYQVISYSVHKHPPQVTMDHLHDPIKVQNINYHVESDKKQSIKSINSNDILIEKRYPLQAEKNTIKSSEKNKVSEKENITEGDVCINQINSDGQLKQNLDHKILPDTSNQERASEVQNKHRDEYTSTSVSHENHYSTKYKSNHHHVDLNRLNKHAMIFGTSIKGKKMLHHIDRTYIMENQIGKKQKWICRHHEKSCPGSLTVRK
ncbi:unnamed protein product, partial [Meganyctiphanes norvegica]